MADAGQAPIQLRDWWRWFLRAGEAEAGVEWHRFLREVAEAAAMADQVNSGLPISMESVAWRLQVEWDLLAGNAAGEADDSMEVEDEDLHPGAAAMEQGALVCPSPEQHGVEQHGAERAAERAARKRKWWEEQILAEPLGGDLAAEPKGKKPEGGGRGSGA